MKTPVLAIQPASTRLAAVCACCHNSGKDWRIRRPAVTSMDVMVRYAKAVYRPWNTIFQKLIVFGPAVTCAVRQQRSGHIINMSSMGGYQVTIVEPSYFRTDFLDDQLLGRTRQRIDHYDATVGAVREVAASRHHAQLGNPAMLGKALPEIVNLPQPPLRPPLASDTVIENKTRSVSQELRFRQRNRMG